MKKSILSAKLALTLSIFVIGLCACPNPEDPKDPPVAIENTCNACESTPTPQPVSIDYFKSLISAYRDNHWTTINTHLNNRQGGGVDSRSVWFDLNQLKAFIYDIESKVSASCEGQHCDQHLGIRFYFGEYDNTNPQYAGYHTLVMVPTIKNSDRKKWNTPEENLDFDPALLAKCQPQCIDSTKLKLMVLVPEIKNLEMGVMNHGALIPPPDKECTGALFMHYVDYLDNKGPYCSCQ
ncbi:MAG: hypothetical protein R2831_06845 [Chitinophagaceae bacterium]